MALKELALHERFEMEALERLKNKKLLAPLVFGGGTILRLCHELPRYSVDLDFWFFKKIDEARLDSQMKRILGGAFELTDAAKKKNTLLYEFRKAGYPRRLKIEIRREIRAKNTEEKIAFSVHGTRQVLLRGFTLDEMTANKIAAFLGRGEVRDGFDIEFLIRRGVPPPESPELKKKIRVVVLRYGKYEISPHMAMRRAKELNSRFKARDGKILLVIPKTAFKKIEPKVIDEKREAVRADSIHHAENLRLV